MSPDQTATRFGAALAQKMFDARRAHGGATRPVYMQVSELDLGAMLAAAFQLGGEHSQRVSAPAAARRGFAA